MKRGSSSESLVTTTMPQLYYYLLGNHLLTGQLLYHLLSPIYLIPILLSRNLWRQKTPQMVPDECFLLLYLIYFLFSKLRTLRIWALRIFQLYFNVIMWLRPDSIDHTLLYMKFLWCEPTCYKARAKANFAFEGTNNKQNLTSHFY